MANESASSGNNGEDEDEVLFEGDFILAQPEKAETLYLLQYPLRSNAIPIGSERKIEGVDVRSRHGRVQMRISVQPTIEQLGVKYGGSFDEDQPTKQIGQTQILRSLPATTRPHANYTVCRFLNGAIVAVPLRSISQMRPTFDYLDIQEIENAKQRLKIEPKQNNVTSNEPLQITFPKRESEKAAERRRNSHAAIIKRESEEPWISLEYKNHTNCKLSRENLFGQIRIVACKVKLEHQPVRQILDDDTDYLDLFDAHTRRNIAKRRWLKTGPVSDALQDLLENARLVSFANCLNSTTASHQVVLDTLKNLAICLRGNWIIKRVRTDTKDSNVIQKDDAARTLILNLFRKSKIVTTINAMETAQYLTEDRVLAVLNEVAVRQNRGWVFKLPDDELFKEVCKDVVEKQESDWNLRVEMAERLLAKGASRKKKKTAS